MVLLFSLSTQANGQSSCIPGQIYRQIRPQPPKYDSYQFSRQIGDLEHVPGETPYVRLFVQAKRLNVRDWPNSKVVGVLFRGQEVYVYARKGSWLAIRESERNLWVHQNYLGHKTWKIASAEELQEVCSFEQMSVMLTEEVKSSDCISVAAFVTWNNEKSYLEQLIKFMDSKGLNRVAHKMGFCRFQLFQNYPDY